MKCKLLTNLDKNLHGQELPHTRDNRLDFEYPDQGKPWTVENFQSIKTRIIKRHVASESEAHDNGNYRQSVYMYRL